MSTRKLLTLAVIAVILLLVTFGPLLIEKIGVPIGEDKLLVNISNIETIQKIGIQSAGKERIEIIKEGETWKVQGYAVSSDISIFLENIKNASISTVASTNPQNHETFEVTDEKATIVELFQGGSHSQKILIGKQGSTTNTFYARLPETAKVYLVTGNVRSYLLRDVDDWRDKVLFQVNEGDVTNIKVTQSQGNYELSKSTEGVWHLRYENTSTLLSESEQNKIFTTLLRLEGSGFDSSLSAADIKNQPEAEIVITNNNDGTIHLWLKKQDAEWLSVVNDTDIVYVVPDYKLSSFFVEPFDLSTDANR